MSTAGNGRKAAIVTGGRRGIGRASALALGASGFDVLLVDIAEDEAARTTLSDLAGTGARARFVKADIRDVAAHQSVVDAAYQEFGRLDGLANVAGVQVKTRGDLLDATPESFDEVLGVNLRGTFFLTQQVARRMLSDGQPTEGRSIVTITSTNAFVVSLNKAEYCISKAGLSMVARLFALRLAQAGIASYEIRPGYIRTDMTADIRDRVDAFMESGGCPAGRWGEPDEVGRTVAALMSGVLPYASGTAIDTAGGLNIHAL